MEPLRQHQTDDVLEVSVCGRWGSQDCLMLAGAGSVGQWFSARCVNPWTVGQGRLNQANTNMPEYAQKYQLSLKVRHQHVRAWRLVVQQCFLFQI